jgi:hypothetical protein
LCCSQDKSNRARLTPMLDPRDYCRSRLRNRCKKADSRRP